MPSTRPSSKTLTEVEYAVAQIAGTDGLRYITAGDGQTIVWLHGGFGLYPSAGTDLLTRSHRLIAIEMPGFGSSVELDTAASLDELSDQLDGAIAALGLERFVLHGTSFGGAVALHLALGHPDRISGLVLESPAAFRPVGWTPPDMETIRRGLFRNPERIRKTRPAEPDVARRQRDFVNRLSLSVDGDALRQRLRKLSLPMRLIFGEADLLTPVELAPNYCDYAPACELVVIPDAAHVVSSDQPELYARAVEEFVQRLAA